MVDLLPARLDDLGAIEAALWHELADAVRNPAHAWHIGVLATSAAAGPEARCIVLREADRAQRSVVFFTDSRSPKVSQVQARPEGVIVLWSCALSWQLRLSVTMHIATAGLGVSSRWARLKMTPAAQDYLAPLSPGSTITGPAPRPRPERSTREHFAVVTATVRRSDWLELHAEGHRRAIFDAEGPRWVMP